MTTWMVVEDEPDLYELVLAMYATLGIDGVAFTTGEEAVSWLAEVEKGYYAGELPELALLDIRLPGQINGSLVSARLRQTEPLSSVPVVLMTAYRLSHKEEKALLYESGANLLMYKPLPTTQEFHRIMRKLLSNNHNHH